MPQTQEQQDSRLGNVEQKLGLLDYRLTKNEEILMEIKEAIQKIVILTEKQQVLREDMSMLEKRVEEAKVETKPFIEDSQKAIARAQGAGIIFTMLLSVVGWVAVQNISRLDVHGEILSQHKSEIAVLKNTFDAHKASDDAFHKVD